MKASSHLDICLIVRECGERTADACVQRLRLLFPDQPVFRVTGTPFVDTLREGLRLGLSEQRSWTLCIDADVLALPALCDFVMEAKLLPVHYAEAQGLVIDKLLPARRPAGNHLYRTELIPKALSCIPSPAGLRPESAMMDCLANRGHPYHQSSVVIGLHDFEQSASDIQSKAALHAHKHAYLAEQLLPLWERWGAHDEDYRIARQAFVTARNKPAPLTAHRDVLQTEMSAPLPRAPLGALTEETIQMMLSRAPHLRTEAQELRTQIEAGVAGLMLQQRRLHAQTLSPWLRRWRRLTNRYPYPIPTP